MKPPKDTKIKIHDVEIDEKGNNIKFEIPLDWLEVICSLCGNEAFRVEGILGGHPEIKTSNDQSVNTCYIICHQCRKVYELVAKRKGKGKEENE